MSSSSSSSTASQQQIVNSVLKELISVLFQHEQQKRREHHQSISGCCYNFFLTSSSFSVAQTVAEHVLYDKVRLPSSSSSSDKRVQILEFASHRQDTLSVSICAATKSEEEITQAKSIILALLFTLQKSNSTKTINIFHCLESPFAPSCAEVSIKLGAVLQSIIIGGSINKENNQKQVGFAELQEVVLATPSSKTVIGTEKILDSSRIKESTVIELEEEENHNDDENNNDNKTNVENMIRRGFGSSSGNKNKETSEESFSSSWSISQELEKLCLMLLPVPPLPNAEVVDADGSRRFSLSALKFVLEDRTVKKKTTTTTKTIDKLFSSFSNSKFESRIKEDLKEMLTERIQNSVSQFEQAFLMNNNKSYNNAMKNSNEQESIVTQSSVVNTRQDLTKKLHKVIEESVLDVVHVQLSKKFSSFIHDSFAANNDNNSSTHQSYKDNNQQQQIVQEQFRTFFDSLRSTKQGSFLRDAVLESTDTKEMADRVVQKMIGNDILNKLTDLIEDLQVVAAA